ncbi:MAG: hypothetical protein Q8R82_22195 [Hyphomonadaceae bacterium]|nr:hypothetical protein [Hyphomonadaceae bacterium]
MPDPDKAPEEANDPDEAAEKRKQVDFDSALSSAVEQKGGAALANIGKRRGSELFRE